MTVKLKIVRKLSVSFFKLSGTVNQKTEQMALPSSLNITFHVMVQMSAWSWSNDSQMTIRFGNPELGGWVKNAGELAVKR